MSEEVLWTGMKYDSVSLKLWHQPVAGSAEAVSDPGEPGPTERPVQAQDGGQRHVAYIQRKRLHVGSVW